MLRRLVVVAALASACGEEGEDGPQDRLQGKWSVELANGCVEVVAFDDDAMEVDVICELTDGGIGMWATTGTVATTDSTYDFKVTASSCTRVDQPNAPTREQASYSFQGKQLRITTPQGTLLLDKVADNQEAPGGAFAEFGCFLPNGDFVPRPVRAI